MSEGGKLCDESSPKGGRRRSSLDKKGGKEMKKNVKKEVVTAASVFSMGPADRPIEGRQGDNMCTREGGRDGNLCGEERAGGRGGTFCGDGRGLSLVFANTVAQDKVTECPR